MLILDASIMESRLKAITNKVDLFKETDDHILNEMSSLDLDAYVIECSWEADNLCQIKEYSKQQQLFEKKLASLNLDIESQATEIQSLTKKKDELMHMYDMIKNKMSKELADLKSKLSSNHHVSSMSRSPGLLQISNLLNLITSLDWNVEGCNDSKIEGHLVSRSLLKSFTFELNTNKAHEVQESLWDLLHDGGFSQSFESSPVIIDQHME